MTVIAYRDGILAADTLGTSECNSYKYQCDKLFRKGRALIGVAGDDAPGVVFVDWFGSGKPKPEVLVTGEADFEALVVTSGGVFRFDKWCHADRWRGRFFAIGSGAQAALGAMHRGATAVQAARIACKISPLCGLPIVYISLKART